MSIVTPPNVRVRIQRLPKLRLAAIRHIGPYQNIGPVFEQLTVWAGPRGALGPSTQFIAICHDDPECTPAEKIRCDCCISVSEAVAADPASNVAICETPAGEYAIVTYRGPYDGLTAVYQWAYSQWLPQSGREPTEFPPFEAYLNDCENTPPEELLTEVHIALT